MDGSIGETSNVSYLNSFSHVEIQRDWILNREGQYIYGTISLDRFLRPQGLQCTDNPGCGTANGILSSRQENSILDFPTSEIFEGAMMDVINENSMDKN